MMTVFVTTVVSDPPLAFGAMALMGLCATVLLGILPIKSALAGFSETTIWMIAAAFFISRGFISTGFGRRVGYWFTSKLGHNSLGIAYALVLTDLLFAPPHQVPQLAVVASSHHCFVLSPQLMIPIQKRAPKPHRCFFCAVYFPVQCDHMRYVPNFNGW